MLNDRDDLSVAFELCVLSLSSTDCSYALVEKSNMRPLKLYVYNSESEQCREVQVVPNQAWGGEGRSALGLVLPCHFLSALQLGLRAWIWIFASHSAEIQHSFRLIQCISV